MSSTSTCIFTLRRCAVQAQKLLFAGTILPCRGRLRCGCCAATATVAIITPTTGEIVSILENNNDIENYKEAIEKAKTKEKALENPPA